LSTGLCLLIGVLSSAAGAQAAECTNTWTGPVSGEWQVAENWSAEHAPTAEDVACIPKEKTAQVVSGTNSVEIVQGEGRLSILGGSLALLGLESSHIDKLHLVGGALKGPAELLVTNFLNADGGAMEGAGNTVIGAEASGHVDAPEEGEGPGLLLAEKRILNVKGTLDVAGLGGKLNAVEGALLSIQSTGELDVNGPEGRIGLSESADLFNANDVSVAGPEGRLTLDEHASLFNSGDLRLEAASGGLISQDEASIENTGNLTIEGSAGEVRAEGTTIENFGTLDVEAPEGQILGSKGAELDNSGTLIINGEGEGNGLVAGTGTVPTLTNTGTVLKDEGFEMAIVEFKVDNEKLVEVKSGALAFTGGGNSGQEHLDSWRATGEETKIAFNGGAFTFGEEVAMAGLILALDEAELKGHRFDAEEAEVWVSESSLEMTVPEEESHFGEIAISAGKVRLVKNGLIAAEEVFLESGTLEIADDSTANLEIIEQESGTTALGDRTNLNSEAVFIEGGALKFGAEANASIEDLFQVAGATSFAADGELISDGIFVEGGSLELAASPILSFGGFFQEEEAITTIGSGGTFSGRDAFVDGGSFELGADTEAELEAFFHEEGVTVLGSGATMSAERAFLEEGSFTMSPGSQGTFERLFQEEATTTIGAGAAIAAEKGFLEEGRVDGAGTLEVATLRWEETTMAGSGSTIVTELGTLKSGESFATLDERKLIMDGFFSIEKSTLVMANGARLENEGEFNASSEMSSFGAQIQVAESSTINPRIVNSKEFNKESGTGTTEVTVPFENNGTIGQFSGTLRITNRLGVPASQKFGFRCSCGDPIETASGDFSETQTDLSIGGLGVGLILSRTYTAQAAASAASPGAFGYGWTSSFSDRLAFEEEGNRITVERADGSTVPFTADGKGGFDPPVWGQDTLSGNSEAGYTYTTASQIERHFAPSGALQSVTDRNGNQTTLSYTEAGRLKAITDPAERQITLAYNGEGLVESAEDPMGRTVKYGYEGKELASVTRPGEAEPRWRFEYDPSHRMTTMIDGRGGETINEYDGSSRVISQTDPVGRVLAFEYEGFHTQITNEATEAVTDLWFNSNNEPFSITHGYGTADASTEAFAYDEAGHLLSQADGNGHSTIYTYNPAGDRTSMTDADENETKWEYNAAHDVISETTPNGETTTIARDANGNPEMISRPAPEEAMQITSYEYNENGQLETMTDPLERTWAYEYNVQGDRKGQTDPEGNTRTWSYDEDSRLTSTVSPRGNEEGAEAAEFTTIIERDPQGRPEEVIDPLGNKTAYAHDGNGNLESETDAKGNTTEFAYNLDDELIRTERPSGAILETEYDGAGQVIAQIDGNEHTTSYIRNVLEQPIEIIDPLGRKTIQEFDPAGNLEAVTDPAKRVATYSYDPANRPREIAYSDEATPDVSFEFDPDGNLIGMIDGSGESTYVYDQLGRLEEVTNGHGDTVAYAYNLADEPEGIVYPNGKAIERSFDAAGRLKEVTDWLGRTTTFEYDADSNVEAVSFPAASGNIDEFTYDPTDRMSSTTMKKWAESLAGLSYSRDKLGQLEAMSSEGLPGAEEESYEYDEDNRLIKAGPESFEYDPADNPVKTPTSVNVFDKANQLETGTGLSYEYDELGERTKATPTEGPATSYVYDQAGNLTSVKRAKEGEAPAIDEAFAYNGMGLMTSRSVGESTSHLTWDPSAGLPLLLDDGQASYIYGPGGLPIEQIDSEEAPSYYHHDQLGSTRMLTDATGETTATFTYSAYGGLQASTGSQTTPLGYAGQYTLSQSGLQYLRARVYDPATGQFLSTDPLRALTLSSYGYVHDNPLNGGDPSGLFGFSDVLGVAADVIDSLNPVRYYQEEVECWQNGCSYWEAVSHGAQGAVVLACDATGVAAVGRGLLGRGGAGLAEGAVGSTGRSEATNLTEQLAMKEAVSDPLAGTVTSVEMADTRWLASKGWVKMAQNINGVEVHYVYNMRTGAAADFKYVGGP
jgi:RHS repeat-associated protein